MTSSNKSNAAQNVRNNPFHHLEVDGDKYYLFNKRLIDILSAIIGIVLLSPIFLLVALTIKLEDRNGPIFFKQVRVGKDGNEFNMYKFRSMVSNAEDKLQDLLEYNEVAGPMFKMRYDPRITRVGMFIRKTSIDELPQFFNVLKGEMSLVGPRPPLPREVKLYTDYDKQRLAVIPGCTGLWQVSGRNSLGFEQMVELDLKYISKRNLALDLIIIFKTIAVVFGKNAY
ncbi:sugar transferase [Fictibacillus sp. b24]|nr:sugar transferase [Fictibacillus sp. b24]MDM5314903.1 sugar transferase [Fictibacillus sp. b24]